ncbi:hypothetical protein B0H16DRAFT_1465859 [Mycena metata]|uniref:Uncharacterized protein n=1 Tax=Mycena metata TaxID=1033252 RepID=A0AAD7IAI7_9AGAR|nr:hypothetical protein B0H16DRAFT_1465859 [Mycena metata]
MVQKWFSQCLLHFKDLAHVLCVPGVVVVFIRKILLWITMRGILRHLQIGVSDKALMWEELKTIFAREGNGTSVLVVQSVAFDVIGTRCGCTLPALCSVLARHAAADGKHNVHDAGNGRRGCRKGGGGGMQIPRRETFTTPTRVSIRAAGARPELTSGRCSSLSLSTIVYCVFHKNFVPCAAVLSNPLVTSFKFVLWYICVDLWAEFVPFVQARMLVPHSPENSVVIVHSISFGPEPARKPGAKPRIIKGNPPRVGGNLF